MMAMITAKLAKMRWRNVQFFTVSPRGGSSAAEYSRGCFIYKTESRPRREGFCWIGRWGWGVSEDAFAGKPGSHGDRIVRMDAVQCGSQPAREERWRGLTGMDGPT
jgi:hypothetical protein